MASISKRTIRWTTQTGQPRTAEKYEALRHAGPRALSETWPKDVRRRPLVSIEHQAPDLHEHQVADHDQPGPSKRGQFELYYDI